MPDQRQDLLYLLREVYALAQKVEHLLKGFRGRHTSPALAATIDAYLNQTLAQRRLLCDCLRRIEGDEPIPRSANPDAAVNHPPPSPDQSGDDALDELDRVHTLILQEIGTYSSCIATSETSGFFETKLACESILSQKFAFASWLSRDARLERGHAAVSGGAETQPPMLD